jgi:hypothetical protein
VAQRALRDQRSHTTPRGNVAGTHSRDDAHVTNGYRSYVIRVRAREDESDAVRVDVEDLQNGDRAALTGAPARDYAEELDRLVGNNSAGESHSEASAGFTGTDQPLAPRVDSRRDGDSTAGI